jgi:hypothetical protein
MKKAVKYALTVLALCFAILVVVCLGAVYSMRRNAQAKWKVAEDHLVTHRDVILEQARSLVTAVANDGTTPIRLNPSAVPTGLAIPQLVFVDVWPTHVNLALYTSPDVVSGFRVWTSPMKSEYEDKHTAIPFVFRYSYCDDYPESASNRP